MMGDCGIKSKHNARQVIMDYLGVISISNDKLVALSGANWHILHFIHKVLFHRLHHCR